MCLISLNGCVCMQGVGRAAYGTVHSGHRL
uniref:Uncharacterized protein n=1 Tax=Anguilla anguilla TaxID=7936 RepID=A0A0E9QNY9_ANGAN